MKKKIQKLLDSNNIADIKIGLILLSKNLPKNIDNGFLDYTLNEINGQLSLGFLFKGFSLHLGYRNVIYSNDSINIHYYHTMQRMVKRNSNFEKYE